MTVRSFIDRRDPRRIDLHNKIYPKTGVRYLGQAWLRDDGRWLCLADVGALCVVEIQLVIDEEAAPTSDPKEILLP